MVYTKWVKEGDKVYGPYFYETVRDEDGKLRTLYLGTEPPRREPEPDPLEVTPHRDSHSSDITATALAILFVLLFGYLNFTGFLASIPVSHTQDANLIFDHSQNYTLEMEFPGNLSSLSLSGAIVGNGSVRVYLGIPGKNLLILDSESLSDHDSSQPSLPVTGRLINLSTSNEALNFSGNDSLIDDNASKSTEVRLLLDNQTASVQSLEKNETQYTDKNKTYSQENESQAMDLNESSYISEKDAPPAVPGSIPHEKPNEKYASQAYENLTLPTNPVQENATQNATTPSENATHPGEPQNLTVPGENTTATPDQTTNESVFLTQNDTNITLPQETPAEQPKIDKKRRYSSVCEETCLMEPVDLENLTLIIEAENGTEIRIQEIEFTLEQPVLNNTDLPPRGSGLGSQPDHVP